MYLIYKVENGTRFWQKLERVNERGARFSYVVWTTEQAEATPQNEWFARKNAEIRGYQTEEVTQ